MTSVPLSFSVSPLARLNELIVIDTRASLSTSLKLKSLLANVFGVSSFVDTLLADATGTSFTAFEGGSPLYAPAGVWSVPDGSAQGQPVLEDGRWRVLVGQFSLFGTLNASLQLQWNMSGNEANGGRWNAGGAWTFNGVPAPGAMAVLGLGCLVGRRRRR